MKKKMKFTGFDGKTETREITIRDLAHLQAQILYPAKKYKDKIKRKKPKYKPNYLEEE